MINGIQSISAVDQVGNRFPYKTETTEQSSFGDMLQTAFDKVNEAQLHGEEMTAKLVTGEVENLHEVLIATEKASVALQLTVQVRDKAIEAYQEVMRMQI